MMEITMRYTVAALSLILAASPAMAEITTGSVTLTMIRTGWNADSFAIVTLEPVVNPRGCFPADGYVATKPAPGYNTFYDAAKLAWSTTKRVQVAIDTLNCSPDGRPKINGINVLR
jgi:hypothetical protein